MASFCLSILNTYLNRPSRLHSLKQGVGMIKVNKWQLLVSSPCLLCQ